MTYEQAAAIVEEGLSRQTRRHRSVALGVSAQFEFTLRQIDVIGEWRKIDGTQQVQPGEVLARHQVWRPGLRFEESLWVLLIWQHPRTIRPLFSTSPLNSPN